jgi:eukaryotic-like serine/threonine-protein kinase
MMEPGQYVTSNVRLVRKLGEGGMGSVWIAYHQTLQTEVAVKFMSTALASDQGALARFSREAAAAAQIKSPHVVQTYDHGVTPGGLPFIVMELLQGEDLRTRIKRLGGVGLQDTAKILTQACKALGRAHAVGIVHRDIKPDNIFVLTADDDLFVKILDFGIAKTQGATQSLRMTATGAMIGTPYYMSPEQMMNAKDVDLRADLWSLAVVVYHCLTGRVPFDSETFAGLCIAIDKGQYQPPTSINVQLPPAVDRWFARALAVDRQQRFSSAKEMAGSFESVALHGGSVRPPMVSSPGIGLAGLAPAVTGVSPPTLTGASVTSAPAPTKSMTPIVIGLFAFAFLILAGGVGTWFFLRPSQSDVATPAPETSVTAAIPAVEPELPDEPPAASASAPEPNESAPPPPTPPAKTATPPAKTATPPAKTATPPAKTATPPAKTATPPAKTATPPPPVPTEIDRGF